MYWIHPWIGLGWIGLGDCDHRGPEVSAKARGGQGALDGDIEIAALDFALPRNVV